MTPQDVDKLYGAVHTANSAQPYDHEAYLRARRMRDAAVMLLVEGDELYARALISAQDDGSSGMVYLLNGWSRAAMIFDMLGVEVPFALGERVLHRYSDDGYTGTVTEIRRVEASGEQRITVRLENGRPHADTSPASWVRLS